MNDLEKEATEIVSDIVLTSPKSRLDITEENFDDVETSSDIYFIDNKLFYVEDSNDWSMDLNNKLLINIDNIRSVNFSRLQISESGKLFAVLVSLIGGLIGSISSIYLFVADVEIISIWVFFLAIIGFVISLFMIIYGLSMFYISNKKLIITTGKEEYIFDGENSSEVLDYILEYDM